MIPRKNYLKMMLTITNSLLKKDIQRSIKHKYQFDWT